LRLEAKGGISGGMSASINRYRVDLRELFFVLFEQFGFSEVASKEPFSTSGWNEDTARAVLTETARFAKEVLGPLDALGDREGCKLVDGKVIVPKGYAEAWKQLYEAGFKVVSVDPSHGGQGAPTMLYALVEEILSGANVAFNMYPALAWGAAELIAECGTEAQKKQYVEKMLTGVWGGTMCLTEAHAGSDVGSAKSKAVKRPDGRYNLTGSKIFISGGDHDLAQNIIHLVLARVEGAPAGTKGLSLFIVPRHEINADGSAGKSNDVAVAGIEHKMGINGSATCQLNFGENGSCVGELVGAVENVGMSQMFKMMNGARIAIGLQGLAVASSAYLNALDYAKERKQGSSFKQWKDPSAPRVPIIEHPDVRRMLLEMKATVEGLRALVVKLTMHRDLAVSLRGKDDAAVAYHQGQVDLLTPLVKAHSSEEAFRLCAQAIQVYGGAGFLKDWPAEQYTRDAKIFSIYEGTTHIQSMDLVGRKVGQNGGANFQAFMGDIGKFVEAHRAHPALGPEVESLSQASDAVVQCAMGFLGWSQGENVALVPLNANRFLIMMSELALGYLLLDAGVKAHAALARASGADKAFYEGKVASAQWYGRNVVPQIEARAKIAAKEDLSPVKISDAAFATAG
jgi:alkylation response protein AidB-like acyl-CoA dehydrogenase